MRYYSKAVFFCSLFFCSLSHAAPLTPADRDTVRQQQEELLLKNQQQREELERSIPRPAPDRPLPAAGAGPCFTIDTITLSGATLISPKTRQALVAPWQGRCLDMAKITELLARISD
ncbi:TPA: ShlB/FhaC/HecB family hemolysin secretion/activation protein, partial [Enterobacter asburiae]|nr:ShlB/FhaC/HecB family hemolysin secretion/activation protein [Enterobacter asburiae]